jgi:hypothetical protein
MRVYECLIKLAWLAVVVAWAVEAAFPQELDYCADSREHVATVSEPDRTEGPSDAGPMSPATTASMCLLVESAAQAHGLPLDFFARLIWRESRFKPDAVGPATRSGQRAQGIAQFMPDTAKERGVLDPFDPVVALPKSAELLHDLRTQFGNLGLAAAAYNAGPKRVREWLAGRGSLSGETRSYVSAITGRSADDWLHRPNDNQDQAAAGRISCGELIAFLKAQPTLFAGEFESRLRNSTALPWGVQLSAGFERDRVLAAYANVEKSYRNILEDRAPIIVEMKLRNRGTQPFYQVRIGAETRTSAEALCGALRKAGGVCMVLRNPDLPPQSL